ncbi:flagellar filament capping protein FliD [Marinobacterium litorale]|uniref:flagellar filament capping protein FliD n=1 Tax=Marinobacterium litorale TaxID=404770 RepID=UPI0004022CA6|nr:flagellar filament capping protein FliD [Marinobacterium litorale]
MSNIISSLGGGSGVDTTSLVSSLVEAERAPQESRLDRRQDKLEAQISAYGTLKSALSEFQGVLSPLANADTFNARSVAFPETDIITPNSLDAGAQTGSYQIEVLDVASAQTLVMGSNSDQKAALGASGELNIQFGAWTYTGSDPTGFAVNDGKAALNITIEASDSLKTIADKINDTDSGIQASVMKVDDQYQLMLTAPSGEDNALQITGNDPSLSGFEFNSGSFASVTETQQASDARLKVNGLEVRRQTNEIDDVITGFNFTLNKAAEGEKLNFSVDADTAVAEQAIRDFVEAYNSLYETTKNLTGYSKDENNNTVRGDLATDGTAKALIRQLRNMVGTQVPGVESGFTALTNVGIRTELDGTLSIEEDEFSAAISQNFEEVANLFAQNTSSGNNYVDVGTGTRITGTKAGNYNVEITQDPSKGFVTGNAIVGTLFDTPLDTSAGDYSFQISVNGTKSDTITLSGTYNSADEVRAELQSLINGDAKLKAVNSAVDVSYDSDTGTFSFISREYGSSSKVSFSNVGADMANLGVTDALSGTVGKDVVGTINGQAGFGAGEVLLPDLESDAYGLNLSIRPGAAAEGAFQINFSRGMGGELTRLIDRFLASDGVIASREDNIDNQLDGIQDDREELDRKIAIYEERLTAQFLAMEQVVSSLNATGDSLDGILDRLPWTAQNG